MKIRLDPDLCLSSRNRTDLRDRFRNKYPEKFVEAGHKFKLKETGPSKEQKDSSSEPTSKSAGETPSTSRPEEHDSLSNLNSILDPPLSAFKDRAQHSLKLLTASMSDPYFTEFGDLTPDDEDPETVTLSRNIFEWADQYSREAAAAQPKTTEHLNNQPSNTITSADQFNINPMLALKVPRWTSSAGTTGSGHWQSGTAGSQSVPNLLKPLPLSEILNGPVCLPSPAELVSGHDAEGRVDG